MTAARNREPPRHDKSVPPPVSREPHSQGNPSRSYIGALGKNPALQHATLPNFGPLSRRDGHWIRSSTTGGAVLSSSTPVPKGSVRSREVSITGTRRTLDDVDRPP